MSRPNFNKKSVGYKCAHQRKGSQKGGGCKATVNFHRDKHTGLVNFDDYRNKGKHTRSCCVANGVDTDTYDWEGKSPSGLSDGVSDMNVDDTDTDANLANDDAPAAPECENTNPYVIRTGKTHIFSGLILDHLILYVFLGTNS